MLKILRNNLNKEDKIITEVEFYKIKTQPQENESPHRFITFKTIELNQLKKKTV